jgi:hypothetical protein
VGRESPWSTVAADLEARSYRTCCWLSVLLTSAEDCPSVRGAGRVASSPVTASAWCVGGQLETAMSVPGWWLAVADNRQDPALSDMAPRASSGCQAITFRYRSAPNRRRTRHVRIGGCAAPCSRSRYSVHISHQGQECDSRASGAHAAESLRPAPPRMKRCCSFS